MPQMVPIKFLKHSLPYVAGETAWFNEIQAAAYIKQGFAVRDRAAGEFQPPLGRAELIASATRPD